MGSTSFVDVNFVWGMIRKSQFVDLHSQTYTGEILESNKNSFGVTDTEAMGMIKKVCELDSHEFAGIDMTKRDLYVKILRGQGVSIRQLSRITGISKGSIEKIK